MRSAMKKGKADERGKESWVGEGSGVAILQHVVKEKAFAIR